MGMLMGILVTSLGGLIMGTSPAPLKFMRKFKYEQFGIISMPVALFIIPWEDCGLTMNCKPPFPDCFPLANRISRIMVQTALELQH